MAFTKEQNLIIDHFDGHAIVSACPGSGKTTTMIQLVLSLIQKEVDPDDILVLTFGKSTQTDFEKRLKEKAPQGIIGLPSVRTFHSLGGILCNALTKKGLMPKMTLENNQKKLEMTALNILKSTLGPKAFKELQGDTNKMVEDFLGFVDFIKSGFLTPSEVFELFGFGKEFKFFIQAYDKFESQRKHNKIQYFADLIADPVPLIMKDERLKMWLGGKKRYILVDEFQDTNSIQYQLVKIVAGTSANVIVVGDNDQSIYEWRGSDTNIMLHQFGKDFGNVTNYTLSRTFRYGHKLALYANNLIVNNKDRADTLCIAGRDEVKTNINFHQYRKDCGKEVVEIIKQETERGRPLSDMAVLVRLYSSAAPVELELLKEGINYRLEGGFSCLNSKEMRNLEFILQIATGAYRDLESEDLEKSIVDLLKFPHQGLTTGEIEGFAGAMTAAVKAGSKLGSALFKLRTQAEKSYLHPKIAQFSDLLTELEQMGKQGYAPSRILDQYVRDSKLYKGIEKMALSGLEVSERIERCDVFLRYVKNLGSNVQDALDAFVKLREKQFTMEKNADSVVITSIHKAKGLEWKIVIMPGLEGSRFPYEASKNTSMTTIESERRLFYVGMTRAIEELHLMAPRHDLYTAYLQTGMANTKLLFGERDEPSRFIFELGPFIAEKVYDGIVSKVPYKEANDPAYLRYHREIGLIG